MKHASHILLSLAFLAWSGVAFGAGTFGYTTKGANQTASYCYLSTHGAYEYTASSGDVLTSISVAGWNISGSSATMEVGLYDVTASNALIDSQNVTFPASANGFESVSISDTLTAGHTYALAACASTNVRLFYDTGTSGDSYTNDAVTTLQNPFGGYSSGYLISINGTVTNANAPTISTINGGSPVTTDQTSITITGTNLGAITAVRLENGAGSLTSSQTFTLGTSTSLTWDSVTLGTMPLTSASNTVELTVTNAAGTSAPVTFTLNPPSGYSTVEIGTADTSATSLCGSRVVTSTPPPTSEFVVPATTRNGGTLTVTSACDFTVSGGTSTDYIDGLKLWDATSGSQAWYGPMNVTLNGGSIATTPPRGGLLVNPGTLME